jgi:hypothetical protein
VVDHDSHRLAFEAKQTRGATLDDGSVSLAECLSSFTAEEELDDGTWYCNRCKSHQKGTVIQKLYRLPDILVIHIKRFNMTARFREKIRAKVAYPIKALDMAPYCVPRSCDRRRGRGAAGAGTGSSCDRAKEPSAVSGGLGGGGVAAACSENLYDLYGVSNHIGLSFPPSSSSSSSSSFSPPPLQGA